MATTDATGFAILRSNKDAIWFDAITSIESSYTATITSHPIASGGRITDHVKTDNPKWQMSAVLSDADFNISRPLISDLSGELRGKQYENNTAVVKPVTIDTTGSGINQILPQVIAQFTRDTIPVATVHDQPKVRTAKAVADTLKAMIQSREVFQLFDFEGGVIKTYENCIFTKVDFKEDATTGEGVFPVMAFEQVRFASPQSIRVSVRNRGRVAAVTKTTDKKEDLKNQPSTYSEKSTLDL